MQSLLVTVNRAAGTADDDAVEAALTALRAGADVTVAATGHEDELVEALADRGERRLVVIGGDGSLHAAINALDRVGGLDPRRPVGIIPRGTGNDLAGALGLSLDPVAAADAVLTGTPRLLDVLRDDDGGLVVNAVHAGVGARASAEAERFKGRLGTAAFPLGAAVAGVTTPGLDLRVEVDGVVVTHEEGGWTADGSTGVLLLGVCNGPRIAGGTPLAPGALPDDGLADVVVCTATGPVGRAAFAAALLGGSHPDRPDVWMGRGRRASFRGVPTEVSADGEVQEGVESRTWQVDHHAWSVLVPS
jgi:diacylglycerol kinase family enzyme